jgi:hypothetical protein
LVIAVEGVQGGSETPLPQHVLADGGEVGGVHGQDARTRDYLQRRTAEGLSKKEIIRCIKRYIARQLYKILTHPKTDATRLKDLAEAARRP